MTNRFQPGEQVQLSDDSYASRSLTPGRIYIVVEPPERFRSIAEEYTFITANDGDINGWYHNRFKLAGPKVRVLSGFGKFMKRIEGEKNVQTA